jgi:hypothetical protein
MSLLNSLTSLAVRAANMAFGPEIDPEEQAAINEALILSVRRGQRLMAAFDIVTGADVHAQNERPLADAAFRGELNITRFFERGAIVTNKSIEAAELGQSLCEESGDHKRAADNARVEEFLRAQRLAL